MGQLKLSPELVEAVQQAVMSADPDARDPGAIAQYLAAVIGVMLGGAELPEQQKESILQQLYAFSAQVCADMDAARRPEPAPEAFGIWRPGE